MAIVCKQCGETKSLDGFYQGQGLGACKSCRAANKRATYAASPEYREQAGAASKVWRQNNPGYHKKRYRTQNGYEKHLKRKYGITLTEFNQMAARQDYKCAICDSDDETLNLDHNHDTNKNRGLLCGDCNKGIGLLQDNPTVLTKAAQYISASL
jgi:hypothetical protein